MKLYITFILGLLTIGAYSSNKGDKNLSKMLYKEQVSIIKKRFGYDFDDYNSLKMLDKNRKEIKWTNHFNISSNRDTIFMLEAYDINFETGETQSYGTLWNSNGTEFSYERINNGKLRKVNDMQYFSKYMKSLINTWDTIQIRKEEKEWGQISGFYIYATRIISFNNKYSLNCISFINFSNFKKDLLFE